MKNFGIIGVGMVAHFHARAIQAMTGGNLYAVYARKSSHGVEFAEKFGCKAYDDLGYMLAGDEIDIVTIATPSGTHLEMAMIAAMYRKHIVCEKPLEVDTEGIDLMIAACAKEGIVLAGIFNRRFNPAVAALKRAIEEGRFGRLTLCDANIKWYRTQEYYDSSDWRGTWAFDGGGALMNQSIHTIDLLLYFVGPVKRLSATTACLTHTNIDVEDTAAVVLEFENGARGTIQGATSCWSSTGHPAEIQICGSEGSVFLTDDRFRVWDFKHPRPEDEDIRATLMQNTEKGLGANDPSAIDFLGHQRNFEDVVQAIEQNRPPLITGEEARKSVALINAIYKSAQNNGTWVDVV